MSVAALLTEPVSVHRYSPDWADEYGNVSAAWIEDDEPVRGRIEPRSSQERSVDQQGVLVDWACYLTPEVVVHPRDRISDRFGRMFEIVGAPAMHSTPHRDVYVEVALRYVDSS